MNHSDTPHIDHTKHSNSQNTEHHHKDKTHAHHHQNKENHHETHTHHDHSHMIDDFKKRFYISLILTLPILLLSPMIQSFLRINLRFTNDMYILFILSSIVFFYGGWPFLKGMAEEIKKKNSGMMTLIALAIIVAYAYSTLTVFGVSGMNFFWELATLIDIMLLGHWLEMKSIMGASRALEELVKLMPTEAHLVDETGEIKDIPIKDLKPNNIVLIKPGEKVPVDGIIIKGKSVIDESMLTGESVPIEKEKDQKVIGGSINGEGSLTVQVENIGNDSYLSQVVNLVKEAQESKSKAQDISNRAAKWLFYIALLSGFATLFIWLAFGYPFSFALERMVTVMIISCPHALGLAAPLVIAVSTSISAKKGLLIRNRTSFEGARHLQAIVFDKTGTLTEGKFGITDIIIQEGYEEEEILQLAGSLEAQSEHPIAKGFVEEVTNRNIALLEPDEFQSITGKGLEGHVKGKNVKVVSPGYIKDKQVAYAEDKYNTLSSEGKTVVFILIDNQLGGMVALADKIRTSAKQAIKQLKEMDIKSIMLTGDNKQVANWVGKQLNLTEIFAEVLPHQKADKIKEVQNQGLKVAMTGDGVNDAPALATADLGIAIGAGTDVAMETADIVLVKSDPKDVVSIIALSKATYRKLVQNLWWAAGYNIIAIPLAAGIFYAFGFVLSPAIGAILMSLSTIIVAINAKLLKI
ncbi:copper-translocating P-type ATPase [Bacillus cereus]|uniref:copper-translocating P-type ATPase n=2 Tax=Bacillus TaxID=1386 RepID=UPI0005AF4461|nr:copper-translocating P-type ATPase [Bacillus cereus]